MAATVVTDPATGSTSISITASWADFDALSEAVLSAVMDAYNAHVERREFSGEIRVILRRDTPESVRSQLPSLREKLLGVSLGSVLQGVKALRFQVGEEGGRSARGHRRSQGAWAGLSMGVSFQR